MKPGTVSGNLSEAVRIIASGPEVMGLGAPGNRDASPAKNGKQAS